LLPFNPFNTPEHADFTIPGGQPAALLVHGFPGTPAEMRPLAEALNERGWTARGLLLPGFGSDLDSLPTRRAEDWSAAIRNALLELRQRHTPVMLVGISMGAALSLQAVSQIPIDGLAILAPFWHLSSFVWPLLPILRRMFPVLRPFRLMKINYQDLQVRKVFQRFFSHINPDDPRTRIEMRKFKLHTGMFDEIRRAGTAAYQSAARVHIPLLTVQGMQDDVARAKLTRALLKNYGGPVRYAEVPAGHDLLDVLHPAWVLVRSLVLEFAGRLGPAPIRISQGG
jgi:carboxylesterase